MQATLIPFWLKAEVTPTHVTWSTLAEIAVTKYRISILSSCYNLEINSFHIIQILNCSYSFKAFRIPPILIFLITYFRTAYKIEPINTSNPIIPLPRSE